MAGLPPLDVHLLVPEIPVEGAFAELHPEHTPACLAYLTEEERRQMARYRRPERRHALAHGRYVARSFLARKLGMAPREVPLRRAPDGSLYLPEGFISISHSRGGVLAAAAPVPVGADLERRHARPADLYRRFLRPEEYTLLEAFPDPPEVAQVWLWTLKEAVLKAKRTGLRYAPRKIRLTWVRPGHQARAEDREGRTWAVYTGRWRDFFWSVAIPDQTSASERRYTPQPTP